MPHTLPSTVRPATAPDVRGARVAALTTSAVAAAAAAALLLFSPGPARAAAVAPTGPGDIVACTPTHRCPPPPCPQRTPVGRPTRGPVDGATPRAGDPGPVRVAAPAAAVLATGAAGAGAGQGDDVVAPALPQGRRTIVVVPPTLAEPPVSVPPTTVPPTTVPPTTVPPTTPQPPRGGDCPSTPPTTPPGTPPPPDSHPDCTTRPDENCDVVVRNPGFTG